MPFRGETTRSYVDGLALDYLADRERRRTGRSEDVVPIGIETRFRYNQAFKSVYAIVPGVIMLMLVLIPAMMTAVGVVREKETGSIANFRSTPVTQLEFLVGKQLPYVAIASISFVTLVLMALFLFGVPIKGSVPALVTGALLYVLATTGFGLLMSSFMRTQVAAIFGTAIVTLIPSVNFSGLLTPVSALSGGGRVLGLVFPAAWFQQISIGTFTKGLGFAGLWTNHLALAAFAVVFITMARLVLRKQER
jgi:ribosome-dependent ATPase